MDNTIFLYKRDFLGSLSATTSANEIYSPHQYEGKAVYQFNPCHFATYSILIVPSVIVQVFFIPLSVTLTEITFPASTVIA